VCSDGLSGVLEPASIAEVMAGTAIEGVADRLVELAYAAGSKDNITAIAVQVQRRA
jgi:serine/threonine protein phosphatase PrpC